MVISSSNASSERVLRDSQLEHPAGQFVGDRNCLGGLASGSFPRRWHCVPRDAPRYLELTTAVATSRIAPRNRASREQLTTGLATDGQLFAR
jgi:hypothetical protein